MNHIVFNISLTTMPKPGKPAALITTKKINNTIRQWRLNPEKCREYFEYVSTVRGRETFNNCGQCFNYESGKGIIPRLLDLLIKLNLTKYIGILACWCMTTTYETSYRESDLKLVSDYMAKHSMELIIYTNKVNDVDIKRLKKDLSLFTWYVNEECPLWYKKDMYGDPSNMYRLTEGLY